MKTYISILRGINVSGKNLLKMNALKEMYENLGYLNVTTYIQSGNVIFQTKGNDVKALENEISTAILKHFGLNVPVIVKEESKLKSILEGSPFLNEKKGILENQYICLLSNRADEDLLKNIVSTAYLPDTYAVKEDVIYLFCPDGYGNTKLNNNFWEHKLKVNATTRNLKTLTALIKICETI